MARFAVKTLEFDKVKALLASKTATSLGKAQALAIRTESEFSIVKRLQEETAEALRLLDEGKRFPFGGAHNIVAAVKHAQLGAVLEAETLMEIGSTAAAIRQIKTFLQEESELAPTLAAYAEALQPLPRLEKQLENAISEKGEIKDSASTKLGGLRTGIQMAKNRVREQLEKVLHDPNNQKYFQDALVTMRGDRYVIPIKQEYKLNFPGVVHDQSGSGATLFIEPMAVVNLNNDIKKYMAEEKEEIERILRQLSGSVGADGDLLTAGVETLTNLDVICARAYLAQAQKAVRPMLHLGGKVEIVQGRHPLLDQSQVVPLDIELGGGFNTLLITGPNTGGKTVALKAVGLFALMAQAGLFLPARSAKMPVFRAIYADIGDEQSIEQSLSTFSGHMKRISGILDLAGHATLTLLDELGAGTDPAEGAALAVSILEQLRRQGSLLMATTHYAELKVYALETPGVVNASCEFNVETLMPTYKLSVGVPGKSNAFLISAKLGIPQEIIDAARNHMSNDDKRLDSVLSQLDDLKVQLKDAQAEAEQARYEAEHALESAEKKRDDLIKKGEEELENARRQAHDLMQQVQNEAYSLTDELRRIQKDEKTSAAQRAVRAREIARRDTETLLKKTDAKPQPVKEFVPLKEVQIGQEVVIADLGQTATVTARPDRSGMVEVRAGIMKTKVPLTNLRAPDKMEKRKPAEPRRSTRVQLDKSRKTSMELNLLGYTVDEALNEVDKFLDSGMLRGQSTLYIIHGNGTGALRTAIQKHLRTHKAVKSFRLGRYGEGESGVTVVELK